MSCEEAPLEQRLLVLKLHLWAHPDSITSASARTVGEDGFAAVLQCTCPNGSCALWKSAAVWPTSDDAIECAREVRETFKASIDEKDKKIFVAMMAMKLTHA